MSGKRCWWCLSPIKDGFLPVACLSYLQFLSNSPAYARPTSHIVSLLPFLSATLLPGPRSSPCRPGAIALQLPRHHSALGSSFQFQGGLRSAAYHHLTPHWPPDLQGQNKLIRPMHRLLSSWRLFLLRTQPSVPIVSMI